jgi:excinuclease ABC subunit A
MSIEQKLELLDAKKHIIIKGARANNLKNLDIVIPRNKIVVITGLSGSGKSSLAFDTLFAEGQRKYVESLSAYARQFLGRIEKPKVDYIKGISPAIAIEQKVNTRNVRSTVGTTTEIYDYLKLLYARIGKIYSPKSGNEVKKDTVTDVVDYIISQPDNLKIIISAPLNIHKKRTLEDELKILLSKGYTRIICDQKMLLIEDLSFDQLKNKSIDILIDRVISKKDEEAIFRLSDSIQTAFFEGEGVCNIEVVGIEKVKFSSRLELDEITFEPPTVNLFSFNNPYGACRKCEGFGMILGIDPERVIPDKNLSVFEKALVPWRGETMKKWVEPLIKHGIKFDFPIHRPVNELTSAQYQLLWDGNEYFKGLNAFFTFLASKPHKIQYRVMLSRYRGKTICTDCKGTRIRKDAHYVKIGGISITEMVLIPVTDLIPKLREINLSDNDTKISKRLLTEILNRLNYLEQVGLGYLTLNRLTSSLSGGEFQRIKLSTALGSALVGSMYILDEPSIGLHPRDTDKLIEVLISLKNLGNTVIVVEHEEKMMLSADQIIDIGPGAGNHGGKLIFQGNYKDAKTHHESSLTLDYLLKRKQITLPSSRRNWNQSILIKKAKENNLKNIDVEIPLGVMTVVTGVSGSGKSTLIKKILYPSLGKILGLNTGTTGKFDRLDGDYQKINHIEFIDQNPIGKSSRSNPVTYVKAYDHIRQLFSEQPSSIKNRFKPAFFSFNVVGGRCDTCEGEGSVKIEMQFMADLHLTCETCGGQRFKKEILEVRYQNKNINEILNLTVSEALIFFSDKKNICDKIKPLDDVGLGYVKLGQSSSSLSGGEAQRVKLASFLIKKGGNKNDNTLFLFDEPTTGLHFHDIEKLLNSINALINERNSAVLIEHNIEVIKNADWIIDLGPEGGDNGGFINFAGLPEDMVKLRELNHTARYLKEKI